MRIFFAVTCTLLFTPAFSQKPGLLYYPPAGKWETRPAVSFGLNQALVDSAVVSLTRSEVPNTRNLYDDQAASFGKYVINIGDRQKGRTAGNNVLHSEINSHKMIAIARSVSSLPALGTSNVYGSGHTAV
ncbi:MAG: hypothetical protein EOP49_43160, partial [Sphingobacteriales bacterium]